MIDVDVDVFRRLSVDSHRSTGCEAACATEVPGVLELAGDHEVDILAVRISAVETLEVGAIELHYVSSSIARELAGNSPRSFGPDITGHPLMERVRSFWSGQHDENFSASITQIKRTWRCRLNDEW